MFELFLLSFRIRICLLLLLSYDLVFLEVFGNLPGLVHSRRLGHFLHLLRFRFVFFLADLNDGADLALFQGLGNWVLSIVTFLHDNDLVFLGLLITYGRWRLLLFGPVLVGQRDTLRLCTTIRGASLRHMIHFVELGKSITIQPIALILWTANAALARDHL